MRILIAEDEEFSRQLLERYLEKLGHEVIATSNGAEAWGVLENEEVSFVITDWMMPILDGLELVKRIRSRKDSTYVYIIVLTAKSDKRDVVEGIMEGADDFLTKPYDPDELRVRVRAGERIISLEERLSARNAELTAAKDKVERANKRMKRDLDAAAQIQRSLLPTTTPENTAVDFAWIFRPCDELAGDIFNVFRLDRELVGFYLLDVVGHGVPAALLSVTLSRFLSPVAGASSVLFSQEASGRRASSPSELALELNRRFPMTSPYEQFFTLLFVTLNLETREVRFVSAGHPGPVYAPAGGSPRFLDAAGFPIGVKEEPDYEEHSLTLHPGDRLLLYSDGLVDARNADGEFFGKHGLIGCVSEHQESLHKTVSLLEERVLNWCGNRSRDDISVLAMSISQSD